MINRQNANQFNHISFWEEGFPLPTLGPPAAAHSLLRTLHHRLQGLPSGSGAWKLLMAELPTPVWRSCQRQRCWLVFVTRQEVLQPQGSYWVRCGSSPSTEPCGTPSLTQQYNKTILSCERHILYCLLLFSQPFWKHIHFPLRKQQHKKIHVRQLWSSQQM